MSIGHFDTFNVSADYLIRRKIYINTIYARALAQAAQTRFLILFTCKMGINAQKHAEKKSTWRAHIKSKCLKK